jgi:hypothetical protein
MKNTKSNTNTKWWKLGRGTPKLFRRAYLRKQALRKWQAPKKQNPLKLTQKYLMVNPTCHAKIEPWLEDSCNVDD